MKDFVLAIPKCLQIHENNIIYQSNTTFFRLLLCCYIHLGDIFRLILKNGPEDDLKMSRNMLPKWT
jgi:hypothetical protein